MKISLKNILLFVILFGVSFSSCQSNKEEKIFVVDGVLNLTKFDKNIIYPVDGEWEFYWQQLLIPANFENYSTDTVSYFELNKTWENFQLKDGTKIGGHGFATFHVKIIAPKGEYSLKVRQVISSYKIWINGKNIDEVGKVAKTEAEAIPKTLPKEFLINTTSDTIDIVIQVSNFSHRVGGIQEEVSFGTPKKINQKVKNKLIFSFILLGSEFIFAVFFLFTFVFRRKNLTYLFFSVAIFVSLAFEIVNGEMIFMRIFPEISYWELTKKIDFIGNYGRLSFFTLFVWYLFRELKIINKYVFYLIFTVSIGLIILVLLTPCKIYSQTIVLFMGIGVFSFSYFSIALFIGLFKRVPYIVFSFFGMSVFLLSMVNDILFNLNIINTTYLLNTGLLVFFISHSIVLSLTYSNTETNVKTISQRLLILKKIRNSLVKITSFNLSESLKIINSYFKADIVELLIVKNNDAFCQCKKNGEIYECGNLEKILNSKVDISIINKIIEDRKIINISENGRKYLAQPFYDENNIIKAILIFSRETKKFSKQDFNVFADLSSQIDVIFDNYTYYWNLENININLENIIQKRTSIIFAQKDELANKTIALDKNVDALEESSILIENLNEEQINRSKKIILVQQTLVKLQSKIKLQNEQLQLKKSSIKSSINYSKKIYSTIFAHQQKIDIVDFFEFSQPKEMVSGDFWGKFKINNKIIIIVADSTGRNVSGTFLSYLILSFFEEVIYENNNSSVTTADLLNRLRLKYTRYTDNEDRLIQDSFKASLISYDIDEKSIQFSGAKQSLIIIRKGESIVIKSNNFSIGDYKDLSNKPFALKKLDYKKNDIIYLSTDGYYSQIGEETKHKLGKNNFMELLKEVSRYSLNTQKQKIIEHHNKWKGTSKQVDDILVLGLKFI